MKLALVQLRVKSNNTKSNLAQMQSFIDLHRDAADIIVFPEMSVGGYMIGDRYENEDAMNELLALNETLRAMSKGTALIWGNVQRLDDQLFNAAYFAIDGEWATRDSGTDAGFYLKHLLPNYGFFDDRRYFEAGQGNFEPFNYKGEKVSIQICEDLWDMGHAFSPTQKMLAYNPDVVINISASPWVKQKEAMRLNNIRRQKSSVPFVYVNNTGMQNSGKNVVLFDGGSLVVHNDIVYHLSDTFEETSAVVDIHNFPAQASICDKKLYNALIHAIRYFDEETLAYGPKWIVGVSGGLDSSVTIALLTQALGKERILGVTMPSKFTRDITKNNAYHLSEKLGFEFKEIPIGEMVDATVNSLSYGDYNTVEGLSYENIQARLRGHTLMSVSSLVNGVVSNNGNKIEVALGYATLYGDAIGALAILGDLTKMEVGTVARELNEILKDEVVPANLIPSDEETHVEWGFAPSAELAADQFDPMKWGYHDRIIQHLMTDSLEALLTSYLDGTIYHTPIGKYLLGYGFDNPEAFVRDIQWVVRTMNTAVYKRIQMPPIVSISDHAYGLAYRESQMPLHYTENQEALFAAILAM
ncbi:NAD(+) synthase [Erysipelothrix sp. HDW6C]|uniref:NAD(+) synthase n=1 Tax=Erysipelothrix sp. HDW6C TaxID=2714930 RepID=UPI00140D81CF|nr:NAD(+) synthase [Erysipelothrix sp. HDW6C]QIK69320.1 NAD(+) synthase [Erysipelothrix sp. HDW6C]